MFKIFPCSYEPEDALEWGLVLDEIKGFIKADAAVSVLHADSNPIVLSHRYALARMQLFKPFFILLNVLLCLCVLLSSKNDFKGICV